MTTYHQAEFGNAFEILAGQTVAIGEYLLMALRVPAARQGKVRMHRSGDFSLRHAATGYTIDFTLHGNQNFFSDSDVLIQILTQQHNAARLLVWRAPPITLTKAAELARAALEGLLSDGGSGSHNFDVHWCRVESVGSGVRRPAWSIDLVSHAGKYRRMGRGQPGSGHTVVVDALTGEILRI